MNLILRQVRWLVYCLVVGALLIGSLGFVLTYRTFHPAAQEYTLICGNIDPVPSYISPVFQDQAEHNLGFAFDIESGEKLFKANCNSCHILGRDMTGPDLFGINQRVSFDWALAFVQDPVAQKKAADPYTKKLLETWEPKSGLQAPMPISEDELKDILGYIELWTPPFYRY